MWKRLKIIQRHIKCASGRDSKMLTWNAIWNLESLEDELQNNLHRVFICKTIVCLFHWMEL